MSVRGVIRDLLYLGAMVSLIIVSFITLIVYFVTKDETFLIGGFVLIIIIVLGAIAKFRFWADTTMTLVRKWR